MSQLLLCSSKYDLSAWGQRIYPEPSLSDTLFDRVVRRYYVSFDDLWLINTIDEWMSDLKGNIDNIMSLAELSDSMVFWYSDMYEDLDVTDSLSDLRNVIIAYTKA